MYMQNKNQTSIRNKVINALREIIQCNIIYVYKSSIWSSTSVKVNDSQKEKIAYKDFKDIIDHHHFNIHLINITSCAPVGQLKQLLF